MFRASSQGAGSLKENNERPADLENSAEVAALTQTIEELTTQLTEARNLKDELDKLKDGISTHHTQITLRKTPTIFFLQNVIMHWPSWKKNRCKSPKLRYKSKSWNLLSNNKKVPCDPSMWLQVFIIHKSQNFESINFFLRLEDALKQASEAKQQLEIQISELEQKLQALETGTFAGNIVSNACFLELILFHLDRLKLLKETEETKAAQDNAMKEVLSRHEDEMKNIITTHAEQVKSLENNLQQLAAEHDAESEQIKFDVARQTDELNQKHSTAIAALKEEHSSQLELVRAEHLEQMNVMQAAKDQLETEKSRLSHSKFHNWSLSSVLFHVVYQSHYRTWGSYSFLGDQVGRSGNAENRTGSSQGEDGDELCPSGAEVTFTKRTICK